MPLLTPHFSEAEMACRCRRDSCDAPPMKVGVMAKVEALRVDWGRPMIVTSGSRCAFHNQAIGGAFGSEHLSGNAIDFHFYDPNETKVVAALAKKHDLGGVGTGIHLLHVDDRGYDAAWTYAI